MKFELFTGQEEFEDYLCVAALSVISDNEEVHITKKFREEISLAFKYTQSLRKNYRLKYAPWVLYALRDDQGDIVGSIALGRENHLFKAGQLEYVAIRRDQQKKGLGKFLICSAINEVKQHSDYRHITLTTDKNGVAFYEKCGLTLAGILKFGKRNRYFLTKKI
ncbi:MAG: GNAT family N-acetyltransferase [Lactobacillaceae bacterium]|jgi:GNAT superfamily N-acetyltransferase|nr:GNAT family N-acetyltransferase [Lactobacillaceae bacterium]